MLHNEKDHPRRWSRSSCNWWAVQGSNLRPLPCVQAWSGRGFGRRFSTTT